MISKKVAKLANRCLRGAYVGIVQNLDSRRLGLNGSLI